MRATVFLILAAGAALGAVSMAPAEAALTHSSGTRVSVNATSRTEPAGPGDPSTTVVLTVTSGALTLSTPASAVLGSGAPGTTISAPIGPCAVTDDRALLSASWTVSASQTDFANGPSVIPAGDATYTPGTVTTTGTITVTQISVTLSNTPQVVLDGSSGVGDNTATWNPTLAVSVPPSAVGGTYTSTLTQSVA
jgi:hypothetical protein